MIFASIQGRSSCTVSVCGCIGIAELWLVYEMTGAALSVGFATAARAGSPVLLAPLAGMLADRSNRRRLLMGTQTAKAVVAGALAIVVVRCRFGYSAVAHICRDSGSGGDQRHRHTVEAGFRARCGER